MMNTSLHLATTITVVVLYLICIISKYSTYSDPKLRSKARELLKQSFKWCNNADKQNTISAFRDSIYAAAYLNSARILATDSELSQMTGIDVQSLWKQTEDKQAIISKKIAKEMKLRKHVVNNIASWK